MRPIGRAARAFAAGAIVAVAASGAAAAEAVLGTAPSYAVGRGLTDMPNAAAVERRIWLPDLDAGDVPQGLTVLDGRVFVAAYREDRPGPQDCRIHRFDAATGAHTGTAEVAAPCSHAGGLAAAGGRLFLTDTWALIELDPDALFDARRHARSVLRTVPLRFPLRGSFAAGAVDGLWIGEYRRSAGAFLRYVTLDTVDAADPVAGLGPDAVRREIPAPVRSQGAAADPDGTLWVSASSSQFGRLYWLDAATGKVLAEFAAPVGTEDLGIDATGGLWTVSEAGSAKYLNWAAFHPLVMRLRPALLR